MARGSQHRGHDRGKNNLAPKHRYRGFYLQPTRKRRAYLKVSVPLCPSVWHLVRDNRFSIHLSLKCRQQQIYISGNQTVFIGNNLFGQYTVIYIYPVSQPGIALDSGIESPAAGNLLE